MNSGVRRTHQTRKNNLFQIFYDSIQVRGQQLSQTQTKDPPRIVFKPKKDKYYTIMLYDLHSPKPAYLHYMAVNITDPRSIIPIVSYQPPAPPSNDTHYHVYLFELYEQPGFLTFDSIGSRSGFDPAGFVAAHSLRKVGQRGFYVNPQRVR